MAPTYLQEDSSVTESGGYQSRSTIVGGMVLGWLCVLLLLAFSACKSHQLAASMSESKSQEVAVRPDGEPMAFVFSDLDQGWILYHKSVWKITQGGRHWELILGLPRDESVFYGFCVRGPNEVWLNLGSQLLISTDGGVSWLSVLNLGGTEHINDCTFQGRSRAWIVGTKFVDFEDTPLLMHSTDAGKNWLDDALPTSTLEAPFGLTLYTAYFLGEDLGWISGSGAVWSTNDGGTRWVLSRIRIGSESDVRLSKMQFLNKERGYARYGPVKGSVPYLLVITSDGGHSWRLTRSPISALTTGLSDFHFIDSSHGFAIFQGALFETVDGAGHWKEINIGGDAVGPIFFLDEKHGWIAGENRIFFTTRNGGETWEKIERDQI